MKQIFAIILFLAPLQALKADWDYKYLTLDELMDKSSMIVVAQIKSIEEKIDEGLVTQRIVFTPVISLRGPIDSADFSYKASYFPGACKMPQSHYIEAPPGTKFLLFLADDGDAKVSVLGPCGALRVNEHLGGRVLWYTDDGKPQRFADHWQEKPLDEVVARIRKKAEQGGAPNR